MKMYTQGRIGDTLWEREVEEKKERINPYKKSNTKQWPLYKLIQNLKKTLNVLWQKQQAGNIPVCKNEINNT